MKNKLKELFSKLVTDQTDNFMIQFGRSIVVGAFSTVIDVGILYVLTEHFKLYYITSATISFTAGVASNYAISIFWVFSKNKIKNRWVDFGVYTLLSLIGLFLNNGLLYAFTEYLGIYYLVSKLIATLIVFIWNFLSRKLILYRKTG